MIFDRKLDIDTFPSNCGIKLSDLTGGGVSPSKSFPRAQICCKLECQNSCWKDRQGINDEFHRAFQKIYAKQENVDDSTEAIQDFLNSGDDTLPSAYISNIALSDAERDRAEGEITMQELDNSLFKKMKGSSALITNKKPKVID